MADAALKAKVANAYNKARKRFFDAGTVVEFLKPNTARDDYMVLETFHVDWWLQYDNFNRHFTYECVEKDFFADTVAEATHIRVRRPAEAGTIYKIDRRTVEPPDGAEVAWKFRVDKVLTSGARYGSLRG